MASRITDMTRLPLRWPPASQTWRDSWLGQSYLCIPLCIVCARYTCTRIQVSRWTKHVKCPIILTPNYNFKTSSYTCIYNRTVLRQEICSRDRKATFCTRPQVECKSCFRTETTNILNQHKFVKVFLIPSFEISSDVWWSVWNKICFHTFIQRSRNSHFPNRSCLDGLRDRFLAFLLMTTWK